MISLYAANTVDGGQEPSWEKNLVETVAAGMAGPSSRPGSTPAAAPARSLPVAESTRGEQVTQRRAWPSPTPSSDVSGFN